MPQAQEQRNKMIYTVHIPTLEPSFFPRPKTLNKEQ